MIQANELRIGNYIRLFDTKECYKIHLVSKGVVQVEGEILGGEVFKTNNINPIPLTPEILEKWCGFYLAAGLYTISIGKQDLDIFFYNINQPAEIRVSDAFIGLKIQYLHQLQNLYFALTGEELNVLLP